MNKRQVIILWVIALVLGIAVAAVKTSQDKSVKSATKRASGQTLFEKFPAEETAAVEIDGATGTVDLAKKDGKWAVTNRDGYPAKVTYVNDLLRTLAELKITRGMQAGPSFAPRFGMDEAATKADDRGLTATFKDAAGKELAKVSLGKSIQSESSPSPMGMGGSAVGRYIRNHADESGFYAISEMFPSVSDDAKAWLLDEFISIEKIKSISVTLPGKTDLAWKLTREAEEAEFKLEGAKDAEVLDTTVTAPLKTIFSYARFEDVVPAPKVAERIEADQKRLVTIETFEGFVYNIELSPSKTPATPPPAPATPDATPPPATDNFLMTVSLAAELPKERKKEENEKPEDAKAKDSAFTDRLKTLTEKLAKEKAFAGVTYEVSKSAVESLLKDRAGLITQAKPAAAPQAQKGTVQSLPGGILARPPVTATTPPVEAVTPPISVPAGPEVIEDDGEEGTDHE